MTAESDFAPVADQALVFRIEQFYYREARLLDDRCFLQWLGLLDPEIDYLVPSRHVPRPDPAAHDTEAFLAPERELERCGAQSAPLRHENFTHLAIRASRPYKANAWAEAPAPRTRRMISNVEAQPVVEGTYRAFSNFQLFYSHDGTDNHTYTGCRRDVLRESADGLRILRREVVTDWDVITGPTMALLF